MIIVRSPLRITLGGGGTDLASYYRQHEGFLLAAAIDKYVYVTVMKPFEEGIYLKYSQLEHVKQISDVRHPIIREALAVLELQRPQIEITTLADIPAGTGLGSSGSFTTALLKALYCFFRKRLSQAELAELACYIEIEKLVEPIGKQDQYVSAFGGISQFIFHKNNQVTVKPLEISDSTLHHLEDKLLLFFTGLSHRAGDILHDQNLRSQQQDTGMIANLHYIKDLGYRSKMALESGNLVLFGELMNEHWDYKKRRSNNMSNTQIDDWYALGLNNGAIGGKLVGAGAGGFLMFLARDHDQLRHAMNKAGLEEVRFRFDLEGTKVVLS